MMLIILVFLSLLSGDCHAEAVAGHDWIAANQNSKYFNTSKANNNTLILGFDDIGDCILSPTDSLLFDKVQTLLDEQNELIEYVLTFKNYSHNPMVTNVSRSYEPNHWARVNSAHGQTLLSLAFNYGVLSLYTLTFGTASLEVEVQDHPAGCFGKMNGEGMEVAVIHLLVRDFRSPEERPAVRFAAKVCHEIIVGAHGVGHFTDQCCHRHLLTGEIICLTPAKNIWLDILTWLLVIIHFSVIFFGPVMFIPLIESLARKSIPYVVKLQDPLYTTVCVVKGDSPPKKISGERVLDFRRFKGLHKLRESASRLRVGHPTKVKLDQYDIKVDYVRCLTEYSVPVGLWNCISRAVFSCKLSEVRPFTECCQADMSIYCPTCSRTPWIKFWKKVGWALMILCIPAPYYFRLFVYYSYEQESLEHRREVLRNLNLDVAFDNSLVHYLTPTHPFFIAIYILYFIIAIILAYIGQKKRRKGHFKEIIVGSFMDLKKQSWIEVLVVVVSNFIWPFKRFGAVGCLVAPLYWLVVMPLTIVVYLLYCLPAIYLTIRMLFWSKEAILDHFVEKTKKKAVAYRIQKQFIDSANLLNVDYILGKGQETDDVQNEEEAEELNSKNQARQHPKPEEATACQKFVEHVLAPLLCIVTLYAVLFLLSESLGSLVEIVVFTLMGIIINAGAVLKYVMLIALVVGYSFGCFSRVPATYLKLNKGIFSEIKGRCKDLEAVTSLPSYLQENRGFKSQELSEQADYETPDGISDDHARHWRINDLTLFIDNEDTPRIPKKLFEEVCQIQVSGAPGPVYLTLLQAGKRFLTIVCFLLFVFIIVLSFGAIYNVSSTNQVLATAAGGFLPFIFSTFLGSGDAEIEFGSVSFKSKLDEIITNFFQDWPIYDLPFQLPTAKDRKEERKRQEEKGASNDTESKKKILSSKAQKPKVNKNRVDLLIYLPARYDYSELQEGGESSEDEDDNLSEDGMNVPDPSLKNNIV